MKFARKLTKIVQETGPVTARFGPAHLGPARLGPDINWAHPISAHPIWAHRFGPSHLGPWVLLAYVGFLINLSVTEFDMINIIDMIDDPNEVEQDVLEEIDPDLVSYT